VRITIRLDADVIEHFKEQVREHGGGNYQTLINKALQEHIQRQNEPFEQILRRVLREELAQIR
jgi:metal-responsive CopG/Arc/MetJ family transcriptional regulator